MPTSVLFLFILCGLCGGIWLLFRAAEGWRDRVYPPHERVYGSGSKKALLIYQPAGWNGGGALIQALARGLARHGYTVTVNHPSARLEYDPMDFDLLLFGGASSLGDVGRPLPEYLAKLRFEGKRVLLFAVGDVERAPELAGLRIFVPAGNLIRSIKVKAGEWDRLVGCAIGKRI